MKKFTLFLTLLLALVGSKAQADTDDGLLDRSTWSITTSSECTDGNYGHASSIIDGNTTSYWHTYWSGASDASGDKSEKLPQFFIVDLGEVKEFNSFAYLPRGTSGGAANGTATHIKMFVSTDAFNFDASTTSASDFVSAQTSTPAFDMDLSYSSDVFTQYKVGTSETTLSGRYVMFVITAANVGAVQNQYASCSEFYLGSNGDASYYSLIDESKITALENNIGDGFGQYNCASMVNELRTKYTNKTLTITEFNEAINSATMKMPEADNYYRIVSKKGYDSSVLGINGSNVNVTANSKLNSDVNNIWKLVAISGEEGVKFENPNTGKYIGSVAAAATTPTTSPTLTDYTNGYKFTLQPTGDGSFYLIDGNGHKLNCEETGAIDYWDTTWAWGSTVLSNRWIITEATSIEVALAEVSGKTYASAYLPFNISGVENAKAYFGALNSDKTYLQMTETESIPAYTGFVLVSDDAATSATLTFGQDAAETDNNALTGTNEAITFSDDDDTRSNYLVFGVNDGNVGFYTPSSNVSAIPANKAYLNASLLNQSAIVMNFGGGDVTGIASAQTEEVAVQAPLFDLSGRRVMKTSKGGVYIQNGKKFVK